jgi:hypothetical protein
LPDNLEGSRLADKLQAIAELDCRRSTRRADTAATEGRRKTA